MSAAMDLDLNCSPPSPEPAAQDDLNRSMLRHQVRVKDLHRLYWARPNLTDVPPFWKQSDGVLRAHPPLHHSHTVNFDDNCYGQVKQGFQRGDYDEAAGDNLDVKGPVQRQRDPPISQGMRSGYRRVIDLEKPATLDDDDDVEIVSSQRFINCGTSNGVFPDNAQCVPPESFPLMGDLCRDHNTPYANYGSSGSSDTPDSHSPVRTKTTVSGCLYFDLNVAQKDELNICPDSSEVMCSLLASSATRNSGGCCNNSSKVFHNESSIGSSKGSSVTVATAISADGVREATAAGLFCDSHSNMPFCVETSKHNALVRGNKHHQQTLDKNSGLDFQGSMEIARISSVSSDGGNNSSLGISILGDNRAANLTEQQPVAVRMEPQEDTVTLISDSEMEIFDLNVPVESIDLPSKLASNYGGKPVNSYGSEDNSSVHYFTRNEGRQNISLAECLTSKSEHMAENKAGEDVQSPPGFEVEINRSVLIPETPQGRECACPRLRSSSNGVSIQLETVCIHQVELGEDESSAATAAETLVSMFATSSAWMSGSHGSNSQTDPPDGNHKPLLSLDSFEEGILNLEEIKDDGESIPVRSPDMDAQSCGIKLKRGRGLRDFQREILPGLVSLARHEICDDLHAIGYGMSKTRSRRSSGEHGTPMRTRLPRRCSTAWNR